jgi:hypothetical protein
MDKINHITDKCKRKQMGKKRFWQRKKRIPLVAFRGQEEGCGKHLLKTPETSHRPAQAATRGIRH